MLRVKIAKSTYCWQSVDHLSS